MTTTPAAGYVLTDTGDILLQIPCPEHPSGFALADDDQTWPGGLDAGCTEWELLADDDPRISDEDRERLGWLLADYR